MRLREVVLKSSLGRLRLYHLASSYFVDVSEAAVRALEAALSGVPGGPGAELVERLRRRGLVEEAPFEPIPRRGGALLGVEVEPVGACNLSCAHCFVAFSGARMEEGAFATVLEGARDLGAVELTFNGGEPLLHPSCLDWIGQARRAGLRCQLFTNATLVTPLVAERLGQAGLARANVSLDGFQPDHDRLRGEGAFSRAVAGISALVAARVPVGVTTLVHPANRDSVAALGRFCRDELGVAGIRLSTVAPLGRARAEPSLLLPAQELREVYRGDPGECGSAPPGLLPCAAGVDKLFVAAGGGVYPCHLFASPLDRPMGGLEGGLAGAIRAARDGALASVLLDFRIERLTGCGGCREIEACRGGCRPRAWALTGDPWGPDPVSCARRGRCLPPGTRLA